LLISRLSHQRVGIREGNLLVIDAEKILRMKGIIENPVGKAFENKKEELEYELSVGSSYLQDQLRAEDVDALNSYIREKERIIELHLDPATVNYRDCLIESYRGVEDPYESEISELSYAQNPADPSQVVRSVVFKHDDTSDTAS